MINGNRIVRTSWKNIFFLFLSFIVLSVCVSALGDEDLFFKCDETSGNLIDSSGNGNTGINTDVTFVTGKIGNACFFEGKTAKVIVDNDPSYDPVSNFSIAFWLKTNHTAAGGNGMVVLSKKGGGASAGFVLRIRTDNILSLWLETDFVIASSTGSINNGEWHLITIVRNQNVIEIFNNNTVIGSGTKTGSVFNANNFELGDWSEGSDEFLNGSLDNIRVWNRTINISDINLMLQEGVQPTFIDPTPASGTTNNSQIIINVSCTENGGNVSLWFDANADPITLRIDNGSTIANWTTDVSIEQTYFYKASCNSGNSNSSVRTWIYDVSAPNITINSNNEFNTTNLSLRNQYDNSLNINITFEDNIDLFGFIVNITRNGAIRFNITNLTLSGLTSFTFLKDLDISSFEAGTYNISVQVADSHTANSIRDYDITTKNKQIVFETTEGNRITIESDLPASTNYQKKKDRYSFGFNFGASLNPEKIFYVNSDKKIHYLSNSIYTAHFIVGSVTNGNWIDFEGFSKPIIEKINDYRYKVTFASLGNNIVFNSIGGLNTFEQTYQWYRGTFKSLPDQNFTLVNTIFTINLTKDSTINDIIFNSFHYNNTIFTSSTKTTTADNIIITTTVPAADVSTDLNLTYFWNLTTRQSDLTDIDTILFANHSIRFWGIANCTTFTTLAFNITIKDEDTNELVISNGTFTFNYAPAANPEAAKTFTSTSNLKTSFGFCKTPDFLMPLGNMSHTFRAGEYEIKNFNRFETIFNGTFTAYLLKTSVSVSEILYILVDSSLERIENAVFSIHRTIGGIRQLVFQAKSDVAGQISTVQNQDVEYFYNITHPDFPIKSFELKPILTTYTIKLTPGGENFFTNFYQGTRYKIEPSTNMFEVSNIWINFTFTLESNSLEFWGMNFTRHNFTCIPASCQNISTNPNGGSVTVKIMVNHTGRFYTNLFFKKTGQPLIRINSWPNDAVVFQRAVRSTINMFQEIKANTSPNVRTVLAAVITAVVIGFAASLGIAGMALLLIAVFMNIFFSLPQIGFIHPIFGFFITVTGFMIYALAVKE